MAKTKGKLSTLADDKSRKVAKKEIKKTIKQELVSQRAERKQRAAKPQRAKKTNITIVSNKVNNTALRSTNAEIRKLRAKPQENKRLSLHNYSSRIKKREATSSSSTSSSLTAKRKATKAKVVTSTSQKIAKNAFNKVKTGQQSRNKKRNRSQELTKTSLLPKETTRDVVNNVTKNHALIADDKEQENNSLEEEHLTREEVNKNNTDANNEDYDNNNNTNNTNDRKVQRNTASINSIEVLPTIVPSHLTSTEADLIMRHGRLEEMNVVLESVESDTSSSNDKSSKIKEKLDALMKERNAREDARQRQRALLSQIQPRDVEVVQRLVDKSFDQSTAMFAAIVSRLVK